MLRWAFRFFLLRVLPGRLFWVMTLMDAWFLWRSLYRRLRRGQPVEGPRRLESGQPVDAPRPSPNARP